MKTTLIAGLALLVVGLALGWVLSRGDPELASRLDAQEDSTALYRELHSEAAMAAELARARADSAAVVARVSVDTVRVAVTRWRDRVVPAPLDTAAVLAAFPGLVAAGDSLAEACERAADDCEAALEARDRELVAADSATAIQAERVAALERYRDELADRLRSEQRRSTWRTIRDVAIGTAGGYAVCRLSGG